MYRACARTAQAGMTRRGDQWPVLLRPDVVFGVEAPVPV